MTDPITPWPGEMVRVGTGELFVRSAPAAAGAEPALFVHGLGGSSTNWTDLIDTLARPADWQDGIALRCDALDLPGFGYSPVPANSDLSIDAMSVAVAGLIDERGYWPVHLVANSLGGAVCVRVAARRPDLIRTLTLISPALPDLMPGRIPVQVMLASAPGLGPRLLSRTAQRMTPEDRLRSVVSQVYAEPRAVHPERLAQEVSEVIRRDSLGYSSLVMSGAGRGLVAEYLRRGPRSLWRDAARITAPVLVIYGSRDKLVRPAMAARAARVFRGARVVLLPRTGHVAMMERPALVASEMRGLIAASRRPMALR
jgi:pimeloyl-ACP methyl ester carboxylesterase